MDLNEFKQNEDDSVIVSPNLKKKVDIDSIPLESEQEERYDPVSEILEKGADFMDQREMEKKEKFDEAVELEEATEITDSVLENTFGFNPVDMMKNPPNMPESLDGANRIEEEMKATGLADAKAELEAAKKSSESVSTDTNKSTSVDDDIEADIMGDEEDIDTSATDKIISIADAKEAAKKSDASDVAAVPSSVNTSTADDDIEAELAKLDDEIDSASETADDERLKALKEDIHKKIAPVSKAFDLKSFSVVNRPITVKNSVAAAERANVRVADWALPSSKIHITMKGMLGDQIDILTTRNARNNVQALKSQYEVLYNHIIDENKPPFDTWLKTISVLDVDHLYAAAYRASFENLNFIPYDCPDDKCGNSFLSDSRPFMDLVKFSSNENKAEFMKLVNGEMPENAGLYVSELIQISDTYAITLKEPSIYDAVIRPSYLDDDFRRKYQNATALATYIDEIYFIDIENQQLRPINTIKYTDNIGKTEKARIIVLNKVISTLTSDQYNLILSYISELTNSSDKVKYVIPETNCPKCGKKIEEEETTASQLLFLRHQLAALANG